MFYSACRCFQDEDECSTNNGGCADLCTNFVGGFNCSCDDGYLLMNDNLGCKRKYMWTCNTPDLWTCNTPHLWTCNTPHLWTCNTPHLWTCNTPHLWTCPGHLQEVDTLLIKSMWCYSKLLKFTVLSSPLIDASF